jgi:MFS family permease
MFIFFPVIMTMPFELPDIKPQELAVATAFIMTMFTGGAAVGPILAGYIADYYSLKLALGVALGSSVTLFFAGLLVPETGWRARASPNVVDQH